MPTKEELIQMTGDTIILSIFPHGVIFSEVVEKHKDKILPALYALYSDAYWEGHKKGVETTENRDWP